VGVFVDTSTRAASCACTLGRDYHGWVVRLISPTRSDAGEGWRARSDLLDLVWRVAGSVGRRSGMVSLGGAPHEDMESWPGLGQPACQTRGWKIPHRRPGDCTPRVSRSRKRRSVSICLLMKSATRRHQLGLAA
jgi:hypothetical protein